MREICDLGEWVVKSVVDWGMYVEQPAFILLNLLNLMSHL